MGAKKELTIAQRNTICLLQQHGKKYRDIANRVNCSLTTVSDTIKRFKETGSIDSRPRSGRSSFPADFAKPVPLAVVSLDTDIRQNGCMHRGITIHVIDRKWKQTFGRTGARTEWKQTFGRTGARTEDKILPKSREHLFICVTVSKFIKNYAFVFDAKKRIQEYKGGVN
ncbi:hypothetical protein G9A89_006782 [Geosiphon pyriformis]|nr:hypothetical protein G9A89_006782 [Geosiphon pyriformis]